MFHWEPEGHYRHRLYTAIAPFPWESEGHYRHRLYTAIAPFWFSTEHGWTALTPFWLSAEYTQVCHGILSHAMLCTSWDERYKWTVCGQEKLALDCCSQAPLLWLSCLWVIKKTLRHHGFVTNLPRIDAERAHQPHSTWSKYTHSKWFQIH